MIDKIKELFKKLNSDTQKTLYASYLQDIILNSELTEPQLCRIKEQLEEIIQIKNWQTLENSNLDKKLIKWD